MGIVAIAIPRDSAVPVTSESARGLLTVLIIGVVALRLVPKLRTVPLPRFGSFDLVVMIAAVIGWVWLTSAYWGASSEQIINYFVCIFSIKGNQIFQDIQTFQKLSKYCL